MRPEKLARELQRALTPVAVVVCLQDWGRAHYGLDVLGAWQLPPFLKGCVEFYRPGETFWIHPNLPADFWPEYKKQAAANGLSFLTVRARSSSVPFSIVEAERDERPPQPGDWIFGFLHRYGIRDGLYCAKRRWSVLYVSSKVLAISPANRARLSGAADLAVGRIETMIKHRRRISKKVVDLLTPREREVLQHRAFISSNTEIAEKLGISVVMVDTHLASVRRKLKVDDTGHALLEAVRLGLIEY